MTSQFQVPQSQSHVADLLPAYMNGTLDALSTEYVRTHLLHCKDCQLELSAWEAIRDIAQFATASAPLPSAQVLSQVWAKIEEPTKNRLQPWGLNRILFHLWLVFSKQIALIHKSVWIASPLVILFGCALTLFAIIRPHGNVSQAETILALITTLASAAGVAFIYGAENDAGFEITLSTPTSMRFVMLGRLGLVVGYNFVLSALASAIIAIVHGGGIWEIMQLWLGPMLLLSSITLALSLLIGSWFAILVALILEATQALLGNAEKHMYTLQLTNPTLWQTNPTMLFLAALFIVFAVLYVPRQPRLSS